MRIVRKKECSRARVGHVFSLGDLYNLKKITIALGVNYMHVSYLGYNLLNWNKSTAVYPILGLCATIFSSDFELVAACTVNRSVYDRRVCSRLGFGDGISSHEVHGEGLAWVVRWRYI